MSCLSKFLSENKDIVEKSGTLLATQFSTSHIDDKNEGNGQSSFNCLHAYQIAGIEWLLLRFERGLSCLMADEMGLGKTVQVLGFLHRILICPATRTTQQPALIICPLTVVGVWEAEAKRFFPGLRVRQWVTIQDRATHFATDCHQDSPFDLLLTSYDIALATCSSLAAFSWSCLIFDEAQRLKNDQGLLYNELLKRFRQTFRLLLTGTPIQNNLKEFWALLHFLHPQVFAQQEDTVALFSSQNSHEHQKEKLLRLLVLRRCRNQVPDSVWCVPEKSEFTLMLPLTRLQRHFYLQLLTRDVNAARYMIPGSTDQHGSPQYCGLPPFSCKVVTAAQIASALLFPVSILVAEWRLLPFLRRCANHPYLLPNVEPEPFTEGEHLILASSKLVILMKLIVHFRVRGATFFSRLSEEKKLLESQHMLLHCCNDYQSRKERLLIFSGSTQMLDIVQDALDFKNLLYERLDGSMRGTLRQESLLRFSQPETETLTPDVFLLSTRAGGVGLNIVQASVVVFLDSDWNPFVDEQALSRCFRQGQKKNVVVVRLVAQDTIDEVIQQRAGFKKQLAYATLLETSRTDDDLTTISLLRRGVCELLRQELCDSKEKHSVADDSILHQLLEMNVQDLLGDTAQLPTTLSRQLHVVDTKQRGLYMFEGCDYRNVLKQWEHPQEQSVLPGARAWKAATIKRLPPRSKNYRSYALPSPDAPFSNLTLDAELSKKQLQHIQGDATLPNAEPPWVIVHCVSTSGRWPDAGFFRALDARFGPQLRRYYKAAKNARDLHLGDAHLIPLEETPKTGSTHQQTWVALLVAKHNVKPQNVIQPMSSVVHIDALKEAVLKLKVALSATELGPVSLHVPRFLGPIRDEEGRSLWYTVERLLERYLAQQGYPVFIYYFNSQLKTEERATEEMNTASKKLKLHKINANFQSYVKDKPSLKRVKTQVLSPRMEPVSDSSHTDAALPCKPIQQKDLAAGRSGEKTPSVSPNDAWAALGAML